MKKLISIIASCILITISKISFCGDDLKEIGTSIIWENCNAFDYEKVVIVQNGYVNNIPWYNFICFKMHDMEVVHLENGEYLIKVFYMHNGHPYAAGLKPDFHGKFRKDEIFNSLSEAKEYLKKELRI